LIKLLDDEAPRCVVGMEACGSAHHWARWLVARGFTVKLMAPKVVRAYRAGVHKSDQRDARAIAEATSRSQVAAVRVKSEAAQATQALMRIRERRIRQRVQTANQLRGLLSEFGMVLPKGHRRLLVRVHELTATGEVAALPAIVQELVQVLRGDYRSDRHQAHHTPTGPGQNDLLPCFGAPGQFRQLLFGAGYCDPHRSVRCQLGNRCMDQIPVQLNCRLMKTIERQSPRQSATAPGWRRAAPSFSRRPR
jgi:transposase